MLPRIQRELEQRLILSVLLLRSRPVPGTEDTITCVADDQDPAKHWFQVKCKAQVKDDSPEHMHEAEVTVRLGVTASQIVSYASISALVDDIHLSICEKVRDVQTYVLVYSDEPADNCGAGSADSDPA